MTAFGYQSVGSSPAARRIWEAGRRHQSGLRVKPYTLAEKELKRRAKLGRFLWRLSDVSDHLTVKDIACRVAEAHGVGVLDIKSKRRSPNIVNARHEVFWLARNLTNESIPAIGRALGFDHTTVIHGIRCHEARMRGEKYTKPYRRKK